MHAQIFVNLPIQNMARSRTFFEALGYRFNPEFSNDQGACLVLGENLFAMLLVEPFFAGFTRKPVADARQATEVLLAIAVDSRQAVEALVARAVAAGAATPMPPKDMGFMYQHGFEDLDGHQWEVFHMDESQFPGA